MGSEKKNGVINGAVNKLDEHVSWKNKSTSEKVKSVLIGTIKFILILLCVWIFICSIKLMYFALMAIAGKTAGDIFSSNVFLSNPITGLIIGILFTVIIQSSSTTISIVVAMTAAGVISVPRGIPIVMGANIGTSVTNTAVSLTMSMNREQFARAFAGATVHDCFNVMSVFVLLILELITGYLEALSGAVVNSLGTFEGSSPPKILMAIVSPIVPNLIQINMTVTKTLAMNPDLFDEVQMLKIWCEQKKCPYINGTVGSDLPATGCATPNDTSLITNETVSVGLRRCDNSDYAFAESSMSEQDIGGLLFAISIIVLIASLLVMVKLLTSSLDGGMKTVIRKAVNTDFKAPFSWLSKYVALILGMGVTMVIQSSSVVTSTITPLVGLDLVTLERMYCITVGANMGTTTTALIAAVATGDPRSLQISLCHVFFNISGFLLWFPIPFMRKVPQKMATLLGKVTAKYRWFSIFYLICLFAIIPGIVMGLSFGPIWLLATIVILAIVIVLTIVAINAMQEKKPHWLPAKLRSWDFLPLWMHSLKPLDAIISKLCFCCTCCKDTYSDDSIAMSTVNGNANGHANGGFTA